MRVGFYETMSYYFDYLRVKKIIWFFEWFEKNKNVLIYLFIIFIFHIVQNDMFNWRLNRCEKHQIIISVAQLAVMI